MTRWSAAKSWEIRGLLSSGADELGNGPRTRPTPLARRTSHDFGRPAEVICNGRSMFQRGPTKGAEIAPATDAAAPPRVLIGRRGCRQRLVGHRRHRALHTA